MTQPAGWIYQLLEHPGAPYRLGRHVHHDPRSRLYAAPALPAGAIASVRWTRRVPVFDQGQTSSCTGNAAAGWVATDNAARPGLTAVAGRAVDESYALEVVYHLATGLDEFPGEYPPDDGGSSGLGAAKALRALGLCSSYTHAFSPLALQTALQSGPVLVGTAWYNSMFTPGPGGWLVPDPGSGLAGGHEYLADELDVDRGRVWLTNSWGPGWGVAGRAWMTLEHLAALLADDGDVTVPAAPALDPVPPQPAGCLGQFTRAFRRTAGR
jgi:hypothetical protein